MKLTLTAAILALSAGAALASPQTSSPAGVLADGKGMTLYTFDNDSAGESTCYGGCAGSWPPFLAADGAAESDGFTLVTRNDGAKQWAFNGQPLYYWAGDRAPGDTRGDGVGGVWHVVN